MVDEDGGGFFKSVNRGDNAEPMFSEAPMIRADQSTLSQACRHSDPITDCASFVIIGRERRFEARVSGGSDDFQAHSPGELLLPQIESDEISKTQLCGASDMKYIEGTAAQRWGVLPA